MKVSTDHYFRLASERSDERIEAAIALFNELSQVDDREDWDYAVNRLVKGLITTRQSARFGFSMALAEVIRELINRTSPEYQDFTVPAFLDLVLNTTKIKSSMKGKEERAVLFGRLFGLQILINSHVLINPDLIATDDILSKFVSCLVELSTVKSWLRETAIFTLCQFIELLNNEQCQLSSSTKESVLLQILQSTNDLGINLSTEGVAIYLSIPATQRTPLVSQIKNPKTNWKNGDPLSKGNLPTLSKVLKDVEVIEEDSGDEPTNKKDKNNKQKGSWSPRIPFVWVSIIKAFNESDDDNEDADEELHGKKRKKSSNKPSKKRKAQESSGNVTLKEFWKVVVDETLFSEKSSHERKYWGFEIFMKFLESINNSDVISHLFTPNFMRCLINQSGQSNRFLNKMAIKSLEKIVQTCKDNFLRTPKILPKLLDESNGGCWNFDLVTKSKTVDSLITTFTNFDLEANSSKKEEVESVIIELRDILLTKFANAIEGQNEDAEDPQSEHKKPNDNILKWCLDKLLLLVRSSKPLMTHKKGPNYQIKSKFIEDILKTLIKHSFFTLKGHKNVSNNIRKLCQERLNSILSDIMIVNRKDSSWSYFCIKYLLKVEGLGDYNNLIEFEGDLLEVKEDTAKRIKDIHEKSKGDQKAELRCFELLFSMVLIQLYIGDDESVTVIEDLKFCYEDFLKGTTGSEGDSNSSVVLTEIIMSFLARKSTLLKRLSYLIWESYLCSLDENGNSRIGKESMETLLKVLTEKENKEGQQNLFDSVNDSDVEENDENEEEKEEDDEEEDDDDDEEEEEEEEEESDEENDNDQISALDKETNAKLAEALGIPTSGSGEVKFEDLDSEGEDSYESDSMDDEEMMAMDDQLAKIFKERHDALSSMSTGSKRKAEVVEAKEQMIFFKSKILDLIEIFSKSQPHSSLSLLVLEPIVKLIHLTIDKNLANKAHKLLKTRLSKTMILKEEFLAKDEEEQDSIVKSMTSSIKDIQEKAASRKPNQAHTLACNQACIILAKNILSVRPHELDTVVDIYCESMKNWAKNPTNRIQASMFFDFINWINTKRTSIDEQK